jgi:protein-S-isoprenylcysteine O-methyltransferase Ste14
MLSTHKPGTERVLTPNTALWKMISGLLASAIVAGVILFGAAGRINWTLGWLFFAAWSLLKVALAFILRWHDPELLVERMTRHENTQPYDRVILPIYFVMAFGTILVAGLDGGRFRWSGDLSIFWIVFGYVVYFLGNGLASWAIYANPFFSSESRLQADREQSVTSRGPYQYVRHPGYLAAFILWPVTGLMVESWWAGVPGLLAAIMMVVRTYYEDRMLHRELPGYAAYAQEVRYRLFPGVW